MIRTRYFKIASINSSQVFPASLVAASLETGASHPSVTQAHGAAFGKPALYQTDFSLYPHAEIQSEHEQAQNTTSRLRSANVNQPAWPVRDGSIFTPSNPDISLGRIRRPVPRSAASNPNLRHQQQNMRYVFFGRSWVAY